MILAQSIQMYSRTGLILWRKRKKNSSLSERQIERQRCAWTSLRSSLDNKKNRRGNAALKQNELSGQKGLEEYGNKLQQEVITKGVLWFRV